MKILAAAAVAALLAGPALAQAPAAPGKAPASGAPAKAPAAAAAAAAAAGHFSVQTSKIKDIVADPKAKAALEAQLPEIPQYYDQIGDSTLAQVAPMSGGAIDDAKLKQIQAAFDQLM